MSDFYIFLEETKKLTKEEIEKLSDEELSKLMKEYKEQENESI